jgi:hypothetical protein
MELDRNPGTETVDNFHILARLGAVEEPVVEKTKNTMTSYVPPKLMEI